jgi:hypothetical protein
LRFEVPELWPNGNRGAIWRPQRRLTRYAKPERPAGVTLRSIAAILCMPGQALKPLILKGLFWAIGPQELPASGRR